MKYESFFWLHIKKSAGMSTRQYLQPFYKQVDKKNKPKNFIQSTPEEYNDILNNYRVVLGEYQFKRALFAKKYLYPEKWNSIYSFAFSREPIERCISMFFYLYYKKNKKALEKLYRAAFNLKNHKKLGLSLEYNFDVFLDLVEKAHFECESVYWPAGLRFSTHTAPMFGDITDMEGNVLLTQVFRIEHLKEGLNQVFENCGLNKELSIDKNIYRNKNINKGQYQPTPKQKKKIMELYKEDFELYERSAKNVSLS